MHTTLIRLLPLTLLLALSLLACPKKGAAPAEAPAKKVEVKAEAPKAEAAKAAAPSSAPAAGSMPADMHHAEAAAGDKKAAEDAPVVFDKKPAVGTKAKCPVTKEVFTVTDKTVCSEHEGKFYCHCCPNCAGKFKADPAKYLSH